MKKKKKFEIKRNAQLQLRRAVPTIIFSIWWRDTIFKFYFYWIRTRGIKKMYPFVGERGALVVTRPKWM